MYVYVLWLSAWFSSLLSFQTCFIMVDMIETQPGARNWPWPARSRPPLSMTLRHVVKTKQWIHKSSKNCDTWWYVSIIYDTLWYFVTLCDASWSHFCCVLALHQYDAFFWAPQVCWMRSSRWRQTTSLPWWRTSFKKEAAYHGGCHEGWNDVGMMLPSDKLTVRYWKWPIYSWFTHSSGDFPQLC